MASLHTGTDETFCGNVVERICSIQTSTESVSKDFQSKRKFGVFIEP